MRYAEYIRSDRWRATREWALERAGHRCQVCNGTERLQVHHRTYENLGAERPGDVIVLCDSCHELYHFPNDGPIAEKIEQEAASLTWQTLNHPEAFIERVIPLLRQIKNPSRYRALQARILIALDRLGEP